MFKKASYFLFTVLLVLGLSACGDSNNEDNDTSSDNNANNNEENVDEDDNGDENDNPDNNNETNDEQDNDEEVSASDSDEEFYFDGTNLVTEDFSIEITDHKVLQPGEGNNFGDEPIIGFWFDVTLSEDATDEDIDPNTAWILTFEAIQDNDPNAINELDVGILPDDEHMDSQNQTIKPGGTVSSSTSYELTDDETDVTLVAKENLFTDEELGSYDYSIE